MASVNPGYGKDRYLSGARADQQERQTFEPQFLENRVLTQPAAALYLVSEEIQRVSDFTRQMMDSMKLAFVGKEPLAAYQNFKEMHFAVKKLQEQIGSYIVKMFASGTLTEQQSEQAAGLLYINNNIDRIADRCEEIGTVAEFSQEHAAFFPQRPCMSWRQGLEH